MIEITITRKWLVILAIATLPLASYFANGGPAQHAVTNTACTPQLAQQNHQDTTPTTLAVSPQGK